MEIKSISICVNTNNMELLKNSIDFFRFQAVCEELFSNDVTISFIDNGDNYLSMAKYLKENNLEDQNPFFSFFPIDEFSAMAEIEYSNKFKNLEDLQLLAFLIAKKISEFIIGDVMLFFENLNIPICLFVNGKIKTVFSKYNSEYFKKCFWLPVNNV